METEMRLFVSYAHKDRPVVNRLVHVLKSGGHDVWTDEKIPVGAKWQKTLEEQITNSDAMVLALTPNWIASSMCQWELFTAFENKKPIIPVYLELATYPPHITQFQYFDFSTGFRSPAKIDRFLNNLRSLAVVGNQHLLPSTTKAALEKRVEDEKRAAWTLPVILGLVLAMLSCIGAYIAVAPESIREAWLVQIGLIAPSATFTLTLTPSPTPTATPTNTPTATATSTPTLNQYDVGVAVAYFAIPDDLPDIRDDADVLIDQVYRRLVIELTDVDPKLDITFGVMAPSTVGIVEGETPTEREENAEIIARNYAADIVLYGQITLTELGQLNVIPEFYVVPEHFADALELTGSFRLGDGIRVDLPLSSIRNATDVNRPLAARISATSHIFAGIALYVMEDYEAALGSFDKAYSLPDWTATDGREVLHVMIGNTYGRIASNTLLDGNMDAAKSSIEKAREQYDAALAISQVYSRPYAGLASITYLEWSLSFQQFEVSNLDLLVAASALLDRSTTALERPSSLGPETKGLLTRAQILYWLWTLHADDLGEIEAELTYQRFWSTTEQIVRRFDSGRNTSVQELASEALALMGVMSLTEGNCQEGIGYFDEAIELSFTTRRRMFFYGWLGDCYFTLKQNELARQAYENAIAMANSVSPTPPSTQIDLYQRKINTLGGRG